jgi:hypothetical protein
MAQVSVTRLRLRSFWIVPLFVWHSLRSLKQARAADGCLAAEINNFGGAFWTLTVWRDRAAVRAFMLTGTHRKVMPKLASWCDEASLAHWDQEDEQMPSWKEASRRLGAEGRTSAVDHPSPAHAAGLPLGSST